MLFTHKRLIKGGRDSRMHLDYSELLSNYTGCARIEANRHIYWEICGDIVRSLLTNTYPSPCLSKTFIAQYPYIAKTSFRDVFCRASSPFLSETFPPSRRSTGASPRSSTAKKFPKSAPRLSPLNQAPPTHNTTRAQQPHRAAMSA